MIAGGEWSGDRIAGELSDVIVGGLRPRHKDSDVVIFESVDMPAWDAVTATWAYRWASQRGVGTSFSLG